VIVETLLLTYYTYLLTYNNNAVLLMILVNSKQPSIHRSFCHFSLEFSLIMTELFILKFYSIYRTKGNNFMQSVNISFFTFKFICEPVSTDSYVSLVKN